MKLILGLLFILVLIPKHSTENGLCPWLLPQGSGFSLDFDSFNDIPYQIDTTFSNNLWQVGAVIKLGFDSAYSDTNAIQTDTLNPYAINDTSVFVVYLDSFYNTVFDHFSFSFWHKFDTDTLHDWCILQFTNDTGNTWYDMSDIGNTSPYVNGLYKGSLNNYLPLYLNYDLKWSGKSADWLHEEICIQISLVKGIVIPKQFGIRFMFVSDSLQTNKAGWIIDDIQLNGPVVAGSISSWDKKINISPNPVTDNCIYINYPKGVEAIFELYDITGKKVFESVLDSKITLPAYLNGQYYYIIKNPKLNLAISKKILID